MCCCALLAVLAASGGARAPADARTGVDWQDQVLRAIGSGAPDMRASSPAQARLGAEKAAQLDCYRSLLAQVKGVQVTAGSTVGEQMAKDALRGKIEAALHTFRVVKKRYFSDQGLEMDVEVPLASIARVILPASAAGPAGPSGRGKYTGLVVDARGLGLVPALAPRLLEIGGAVLYGAESVSEAARKTTSGARYFKTVDAASATSVVGELPLVVKAAAAHGSDATLAAAEARLVSELGPGVLQEGRVALVVN